MDCSDCAHYTAKGGYYYCDKDSRGYDYGEEEENYANCPNFERG